MQTGFLIAVLSWLAILAAAPVRADDARIFLVDARYAALHDPDFDAVRRTIAGIGFDRPSAVIVLGQWAETWRPERSGDREDPTAALLNTLTETRPSKLEPNLPNVREHIVEIVNQWSRDNVLTRDSTLRFVWIGADWRFGRGVGANARAFSHSDACIGSTWRRLSPIEARTTFEFRLIHEGTAPPEHAIRSLMTMISGDPARADFLGVYGSRCPSPAVPPGRPLEDAGGSATCGVAALVSAGPRIPACTAPRPVGQGGAAGRLSRSTVFIPGAAGSARNSVGFDMTGAASGTLVLRARGQSVTLAPGQPLDPVARLGLVPGDRVEVAVELTPPAQCAGGAGGLVSVDVTVAGQAMRRAGRYLSALAGYDCRRPGGLSVPLGALEVQ